MKSTVVLMWALGMFVIWSPGIGAQERRVQEADTMTSDTLDLIRGDSVSIAGADTLEVREPPPAFPVWNTSQGASAGGTYRVWNHDDLLRSRALTLEQLLREMPGTLWLRTGDLGAPVGVTSVGGGGEGVRIYLDGIPLEGFPGQAPDLALIGLGGVEEVRVRRSPSELQVELRSVEPRGDAPESLIEAGTGDLDTNLLRGSFQHPFLMGRGVALGLERLDSQGRAREEPGSLVGAWGRVGLIRRERTGVAFEARRMGGEVAAQGLPALERSRTDLVLRGRQEVGDWGRLEVAASRTALAVGTEDDSLAVDHTADRLLARFAMDRGPAWGELGARIQSGEGLPGTVMGLRTGLTVPELGSAEAGGEREGWDEGSDSRGWVRAWTAPRFGVSLFGEVEDGARGVARYLTTSWVERRAVRTGAEWGWRGMEAGVAWLRVEADSIAPFGLPTERAGVHLPLATGGEWDAMEVSARLPLPVRGFALQGHMVRSTPPVEVPVIYLPKRTWDASLAYHRSPLPSGNLEIRGSLGVEGRDPMWVPAPDVEGGTEAGDAVPTQAGEEASTRALSRVPWGQSWYFRLQIRVLTMRIFVNWENITVERELQDYPDRFLPAMRALYGIRWTLRN
ncbi:MAG: TonB-dependent receptor plug domain-containing protein [Gemmatimonadota bacterium]